jgi:hypothetical protein
MSAQSAVAGLVRFKVAAYVRSHRVVQPFLALLAVLILLYSTQVPDGAELSAYTDSAAILVVVFGWAARSLLDTEPDVQRAISMASAGRPLREITGGLLSAAAVNLVLAAIAVLTPLLIGFASEPGAAVLAGGVALHLLSAVTGVTLGALTSRAVLPSPATSLLALLGGYVAMVLLSLTPLAWLAPVPVLRWMRDASDGVVLSALPALAGQTLLWSAVGLTAYAVLRRTRP